MNAFIVADNIEEVAILPDVEQFPGEIVRMRVRGHEGILEEIRLKIEEFADDGFGEGAAVAGVPGLVASAGDMGGGIGSFAAEFAGLREGAFISDAGTAMEESEGVIIFAKFTKRGDGLGGPGAESAHGAVVRAIGIRRGAVAQRLGAHPMVGEEFAFDETGHLVAHRRRKIIGNGQTNGGEIEDVADLDALAVGIESVPHTLIRFVKGENCGKKLVGAGIQFVCAGLIAFG